MAPELIGLTGLVFLFALLALGMPIAFAMIFMAIAGIWALNGFLPALVVAGTSPFASVGNYDMSVIPLFVLMGVFVSQFGLAEDAYKAAFHWLGRLPGGLAIATIMGCAGFAACSGNSIASVTVIGSLALPEMKRYGYADSLAAGCVASGSTLGILIPPSIAMIIYGLMAQESIGKLFLAGIIPGLLLTAFFILLILTLVVKNPSLGPRGPITTWRTKILALINAWPLGLLAAIIIIGIWGGVFTPIESGGVAAFASLVIGGLRHKLNFKSLAKSVKSSLHITAMIFAIMIGAMMLNYFLALTQLPSQLATLVGGLQIPPTGIVIVILLFYILGGCVMDVLGLMMLTLPIFIPVIKAIGYDVVLFGVLTTVTSEMALITPPIGMNVFVLKTIATDMSLSTIFRGIWPFFFMMILFLAILLMFPQITLFLPYSV